MWFGQEWLPYFQEGIQPAIEEAGFRAVRIDLEEHNEQIMDRVIAEIRKSRFVVADLRGHRNGVYFEAGFGFGFGIPTIFTVANADKDQAHFDVQGYSHIRYDTPAELRERLLNRIRATIV
jgi:nucleoside 2-deoxyribosyltransferase